MEKTRSDSKPIGPTVRMQRTSSDKTSHLPNTLLSQNASPALIECPQCHLHFDWKTKGVSQLPVDPLIYASFQPIHIIDPSSGIKSTAPYSALIAHLLQPAPAKLSQEEWKRLCDSETYLLHGIRQQQAPLLLSLQQAFKCCPNSSTRLKLMERYLAALTRQELAPELRKPLFQALAKLVYDETKKELKNYSEDLFPLMTFLNQLKNHHLIDADGKEFSFYLSECFVAKSYWNNNLIEIITALRTCILEQPTQPDAKVFYRFIDTLLSSNSEILRGLAKKMILEKKHFVVLKDARIKFFIVYRCLFEKSNRLDQLKAFSDAPLKDHEQIVKAANQVSWSAIKKDLDSLNGNQASICSSFISTMSADLISCNQADVNVLLYNLYIHESWEKCLSKENQFLFFQNFYNNLSAQSALAEKLLQHLCLRLNSETPHAALPAFLCKALIQDKHLTALPLTDQFTVLKQLLHALKQQNKLASEAAAAKQFLKSLIASHQDEYLKLLCEDKNIRGIVKILQKQSLSDEHADALKQVHDLIIPLISDELNENAQPQSPPLYELILNPNAPLLFGDEEHARLLLSFLSFLSSHHLLNDDAEQKLKEALANPHIQARAYSYFIINKEIEQIVEPALRFYVLKTLFNALPTDDTKRKTQLLETLNSQPTTAEEAFFFLNALTDLQAYVEATTYTQKLISALQVVGRSSISPSRDLQEKITRFVEKLIAGNPNIRDAQELILSGEQFGCLTISDKILTWLFFYGDDLAASQKAQAYLKKDFQQHDGVAWKRIGEISTYLAQNGKAEQALLLLQSCPETIPQKQMNAVAPALGTIIQCLVDENRPLSKIKECVALAQKWRLTLSLKSAFLRLLQQTPKAGANLLYEILTKREAARLCGAEDQIDLFFDLFSTMEAQELIDPPKQKKFNELLFSSGAANKAFTHFISNKKVAQCTSMHRVRILQILFQAQHDTSRKRAVLEICTLSSNSQSEILFFLEAFAKLQLLELKQKFIDAMQSLNPSTHVPSREILLGATRFIESQLLSNPAHEIAKEIEAMILLAEKKKCLLSSEKVNSWLVLHGSPTSVSQHASGEALQRLSKEPSSRARISEIVLQFIENGQIDQACNVLSSIDPSTSLPGTFFEQLLNKLSLNSIKSENFLEFLSDVSQLLNKLKLTLPLQDLFKRHLSAISKSDANAAGKALAERLLNPDNAKQFGTQNYAYLLFQLHEFLTKHRLLSNDDMEIALCKVLVSPDTIDMTFDHFIVKRNAHGIPDLVMRCRLLTWIFYAIEDNGQKMLILKSLKHSSQNEAEASFFIDGLAAIALNIAKKSSEWNPPDFAFLKSKLPAALRCISIQSSTPKDNTLNGILLFANTCIAQSQTHQDLKMTQEVILLAESQGYLVLTNEIERWIFFNAERSVRSEAVWRS